MAELLSLPRWDSLSRSSGEVLIRWPNQVFLDSLLIRGKKSCSIDIELAYILWKSCKLFDFIFVCILRGGNTLS